MKALAYFSFACLFLAAAFGVSAIWTANPSPTPGPTSIEGQPDKCDAQYGKGFNDALTARMFYDLEIQLGAPRLTNGEINKLLCERRGITYEE